MRAAFILDAASAIRCQLLSCTKSCDNVARCMKASRRARLSIASDDRHWDEAAIRGLAAEWLIMSIADIRVSSETGLTDVRRLDLLRPPLQVPAPAFDLASSRVINADRGPTTAPPVPLLHWRIWNYSELMRTFKGRRVDFELP